MLASGRQAQVHSAGEAEVAIVGLSLNAPPATRRSARFRVSGVLASRAFGALARKQIMLQSRRPGQTRWQTVSAGLTRSDGSYAFRITQTSTRLYRVVWHGVCESAAVLVRSRSRPFDSTASQRPGGPQDAPTVYLPAKKRGVGGDT